MSRNTQTFIERCGLPRERPRTGGTLLFLFAIGALVAGAGIAGLEYAKVAGWAPEPHSENAPPTEPFDPAKLTSASLEEAVPSAEEIVRNTVAEAPATTPDAGHPSTAAAPPPKARPVFVARPAAKPKPTETHADDDQFSKPD